MAPYALPLHDLPIEIESDDEERDYDHFDESMDNYCQSYDGHHHRHHQQWYYHSPKYNTATTTTATMSLPPPPSPTLPAATATAVVVAAAAAATAATVQKPKKSVHWDSQLNYVVETHHRRDIANPQEIWYQRLELAAIKTECRETVRFFLTNEGGGCRNSKSDLFTITTTTTDPTFSIHRSNNDCNTTYWCKRGLENSIYDERKYTRRLCKANSTAIVLEEQRNQKRNGIFSVETISHLYQNFTHVSERQAYAQGVQDQQDVQQIIIIEQEQDDEDDTTAKRVVPTMEIKNDKAEDRLKLLQQQTAAAGGVTSLSSMFFSYITLPQTFISLPWGIITN